MRKQSVLRNSLPLAVGLVITSFAGSTVYTEYSLLKIDRDAEQIAFTAAPSIEHLAAMHAEVRNIQQALEAHLDGKTSAAEAARAAQPARDRLGRHLEAYADLPFSTGEDEIYRQVRAALAGFDLVVATVLQHVVDPNSSAQALIAEASQSGDRLKIALEQSIELNARHSQHEALQIERRRGHSMHVAFVLDGLSAVLTVVLALLLWRSFRERTRLMEAHNELLARRAQDLEEFAGRVAHDILSPLTNVSLAIGLARRTGAEPEAIEKNLTRAERALDRVRRIVDGLLQFARSGAPPEAGASAAVPDVINDVVADLTPEAASANVELVVRAALGCSVCCTLGVLTSLVSNLVRNAIKYMGDAHERRVTIRCEDRGTSVRVEVEDTGPGLSPELGETVFEPYVRGHHPASKPGIGLGLATVKRMTDHHGGQVGVRSRPGAGCTFWFELPKALPVQKVAHASGPRAAAGV